MKKYILGFLFIAFAFLSNINSALADSAFHYTYERDLVHGSSGNAVVLLKFCLARIYDNEYGISSYYDIDGYYSSKTERIIKDFQRRNNLKVDGVFGARTAAVVSAKCDNERLNFKKASQAKIVKLIPIKQQYSQIESKTCLSKDKKKAYIAYIFKLRNTFDKDITIRGKEDFIFTFKKKDFNGKELDKQDGFEVNFYNKNENEIVSAYTLGAHKTEQFYIGVVLDINDFDKFDSSYQLFLKEFKWNINGTSKVLNMNTSSDRMIIGK